ncbi:DUF1254 domain-containing protein [Pukyongiella litopenaei]|uniref:DUF1254 domain-containing protein n=1 Tax=Pukyongiella litopenaei TaxID=2605946 RepID=A0A2S0MNS9_9RHOB|nr:DUF1254 domain-containing protein [Pukyongiella litopenaei]AVO37534.1 DUF1254 domain-containing protein [Pukyongiella litopenaei]
MKPMIRSAALAGAVIATATIASAQSEPIQSERIRALSELPFEQNRPTAETAQALMEELTFQRATQTYLWALPLLNTMSMRDGAAEAFGTGYNIMPIWTRRLDAKTKITTPNSDLIYGMVFADLGETGPLVFEAPPKLQGILLDFWQRPIPVDGGAYFGDLGLPGPDGGAGGNFLIVPPGWDGDVPADHYVYRSSTNNVFFFLRSFYQSLDNIAPATDLLKQSVIYPLGQKDSARPMEFPDAAGGSYDMLPRSDARAFEQLKYLVDTEGGNLAGPDWLGMLEGLDIAADRDFAPDEDTRALLAAAAQTGYKTSRVIGFQHGLNGEDFRVYDDRQWLNPVNNVSARWPDVPVGLDWMSVETGYRELDTRAWFFTDYFSISPGMVSMTPGKGAYYMIAFEDADGDPLVGGQSYRLDLPADIPAELFWSVTLYEAENASGLDNGQSFPSLGKLNEPAQNDDGSTTLHIAPEAPEGWEGNWLATVPDRGFFAILRLYAPSQPALDGSWKPGDIVKAE